MIEFISLFILIAGFVIGLGAVTVIDMHGFLGRTSSYWTEATTRAHKITKPMIWVGMILVIFGGLVFYITKKDQSTLTIHIFLSIIMILNGFFLSFKVSPFLLEREKQGKSSELLPASWQRKIIFSFIFSFVCWWSCVLLLINHLVFIK
jgi:hypothetical protein